ncbi:hypothetical protein FRC12_020349, partial [Ceratobasidium sp. 428]
MRLAQSVNGMFSVHHARSGANHLCCPHQYLLAPTTCPRRRSPHALHARPDYGALHRPRSHFAPPTFEYDVPLHALARVMRVLHSPSAFSITRATALATACERAAH